MSIPSKCPKCKNYAIKDLGKLERSFLDKLVNATENDKHAYQCKKCGHTWVE